MSMNEFMVKCNQESLIRSILDVRDAFRKEKKDPGSDNWVAKSSLRSQLVDRVIERWQLRTGVDDFPWNMDIVILLWVQIRKGSLDHAGFTEKYIN